jgi:hypothetical protein
LIDLAYLSALNTKSVTNATKDDVVKSNEEG